MAAGLEEDQQDYGLTTSLNGLLTLSLKLLQQWRTASNGNMTVNQVWAGLYGPQGTWPDRPVYILLLVWLSHGNSLFPSRSHRHSLIRFKHYWRKFLLCCLTTNSSIVLISVRWLTKLSTCLITCLFTTQMHQTVSKTQTVTLTLIHWYYTCRICMTNNGSSNNVWLQKLCYSLAYCLLCNTKSSSCSSWTWKHQVKMDILIPNKTLC